MKTTSDRLRAGCLAALVIVLGFGRPVPSASAASPWPALAPRPQVATPVIDVTLTPDGRLLGQIIDGQNGPVVRVPVILRDQNLQEAVTHTDDQGRFAFVVPHGGMYALRAGGGGAVCRAWTAGAAPPSALSWVSINTQETVIRGQSSPAYQWISEHPWLFYTGLATAITVPLVIATSQRDKPASP
jgi:hypothetical protein